MTCRGTDKHEFEVVYRGTWYYLCSLSEHLKRGIPAGQSLIRDNSYRYQTVPQSEVHVRMDSVIWAPFRARQDLSISETQRSCRSEAIGP